MEQNIESSKFIKQVNDLYATALEEAIALLKNSEKGRYIAIPNWEDEVAATSWNDVPISIWGVGLNDDNHICVKAFVNNVGYLRVNCHFQIAPDHRARNRRVTDRPGTPRT